jgi:hypothetical protein
MGAIIGVHGVERRFWSLVRFVVAYQEPKKAGRPTEDAPLLFVDSLRGRRR